MPIQFLKPWDSTKAYYLAHMSTGVQALPGCACTGTVLRTVFFHVYKLPSIPFGINSIKILSRTDEWVAHPAEEKKIGIPQPEAGTSRSRIWHRLLRTNRDNNWMDKAVMQQVPAFREKQEVLSLLPAKSVPPQKWGLRLTWPKRESRRSSLTCSLCPWFSK